MERYASAIRESIDAGIPVVGYPDKDFNVAVIHGYEDTDETTVFHWNAYNRNQLRLTAEKAGPLLLFLKDLVQPLESKAALREALTTPNWRRSRLASSHLDWDDDYLYGPGALKQWREDIAQAHEFTFDQQKKLFFVSWWCFDCLIDARLAASRFLNEQATKLYGEARSALAEAARVYGSLARLGAAVCFEEKAAFWGPWTGRKVGDWGSEIRRREQEILTEIETLDAQAVSQIDKALRVL